MATATLLYLDIVSDGADPALFLPTDRQQNLLEDVAVCYSYLGGCDSSVYTRALLHGCIAHPS